MKGFGHGAMIKSESVPSDLPVRFLIIDDHPLFREALISAVNVAYPDALTDECDSLAAAISIAVCVFAGYFLFQIGRFLVNKSVKFQSG